MVSAQLLLCLVISLKPIKVTCFYNPHRITLLFMMSSSESGTDFDSTAEMSLSPANDRTDVPVGLSNPQYVAEMRNMLDVVNRLRATG